MTSLISFTLQLFITGERSFDIHVGWVSHRAMWIL